MLRIFDLTRLGFVPVPKFAILNTDFHSRYNRQHNTLIKGNGLFLFFIITAVIKRIMVIFLINGDEIFYHENTKVRKHETKGSLHFLVYTFSSFLNLRGHGKAKAQIAEISRQSAATIL